MHAVYVSLDVDVDVAKAQLDCAVCVQGRWCHQAFTNNQQGFERLRDWLNAQCGDAGIRVRMEASNIDWEALAQCLCDAGFYVIVELMPDCQASG